MEDSISNENKGVILLKESAKLAIYQDNCWSCVNYGRLYIIPNNLMAIYGENSSSFYMYSGTIKIFSTSNKIGGLYIAKEIVFEEGIFIYKGMSGPNHAIKAENITILKGKYNLNLESGTGINAENIIRIGEKDEGNSDLKIDIKTFGKGMDAKKVEIYSGIINIKSKDNGINVYDDNVKEQKCMGDCNSFIKIYDGEIYIDSEENGLQSKGDVFIAGGKSIIFGGSHTGNYPIKQESLLKVKFGALLIGGTNIKNIININSTQAEYLYNNKIKIDSIIEILGDVIFYYEFNDYYDYYDCRYYNTRREIINVRIPKNLDYLYFHYPLSNFTMKIINNGTENEIKTNEIRALISYELNEERSDNKFEETNVSIQNSNKDYKDSTIPSSSLLDNNKFKDENYNNDKVSQTSVIQRESNEYLCHVKKSNILFFLLGIALF